MRALRIGWWLLVVASATSLVLDVVVSKFLFAVQMADVADPQPIEHVVFAIFGISNHAITALFVAGAVACAVGDRAQRRWYAGVAVALVAEWTTRMFGWLASLAGSSVSTEAWKWEQRISAVMWAAAATLFAIAARRGGSHRKLVSAFAIAIGGALAIQMLAWAVSSGPLDSPPAWLALAAQLSGLFALLVWLYVTLDLLGAFPASDAPAARVTARAHGVAAAVAIGAMIVGIAIAATAVWITDRVSSADGCRQLLSFGIVVFAGGAFALRRMRRPVSIPIAIAATLAIVIGGRFALGARERPVEQVTLEGRTFPGLSISLPAGRIETDTSYRERGKVTLFTRHADLGLVTLQWIHAERDPNAGVGELAARQPGMQTEDFRRMIGDVQVSGTILAMSNLAELHASWQCPGDPRWFSIEISRYAPEIDVLRRVAERVLDTIECQPATRDAAPRFAIAIVPPAGYTEKPEHAPLQRYNNADGGVLSIWWSADSDYTDALDQTVLDTLSWQDQADRIRQLSTIHEPEQPEGVVETSDRRVIEIEVGDQRAIATAWHCFHLDFDVLALYVGPQFLPQQPILDALATAHCPK